jgi:hypothetical protein
MAGLPTLSNEELLALAPLLASAALAPSVGPLEAGYSTRLAAVTAGATAFTAALAASARAAEEGGSDLQAVDAEADDLLRALDGLLEAFGRVPDEAVAQAAERIRGALFPEGMRFIRSTYAKQAVETRRILALAATLNVPAPAAIAVAYVINALTAVQDRYDEAVTKAALVVHDDGAARSEARAALVEATRTYVRYVEGRADANETLAKALLAPLASFRAAHAARRKAKKPTP